MMRPALRTIRCIALVALAGLGIASCGGGDDPEPDAPTQADSLFRVDAQVMRPYAWFFSDFDNTEAGFDAQLDYGDPFRATTLLIKDWLARRDLKTTTVRVDKMVAKWGLDQPGGKLNYTFAYGRLPAGWWSGMDSWSFPMLLVGLWQETGYAKFKTLADKLIATASKNVADGGVVWRDDLGCWFSEYAWETMTQADEFYVLNGHLYALQAIRMIQQATGDSTLGALYACGLRGVKSRASSFDLGSSWARYMLKPSVINQTHYVIYETMQFDALSRLDPDPFYAEQAARRRVLLQRYFPVRIRTAGGTNRLSLSALGAPHPYSIDTYALYVECSDGTRTESHAIPNPTDTRTPIIERVFLDVATELDPLKARCRVDSEYVAMRHTLYEAPVVVLADPVGSGQEIAQTFDAILDAVLTSPTTSVIDPVRRYGAPGDPITYLDTQGRLILTPAAPVAWSADELIGLEFGADGALAIGVTVVSEGVEYFRYYPRTLAASKTLVLLSPLGFDGGDAIRNFEKLTVFVYTDQQAAPVTVSAPTLIKFANQAELYEHFKQSPVTFYTE